MQRGSGGLDFHELQRRVKERDKLVIVSKQTGSRTLYKTKGPDGWAYLVVNWKTREIVTILSEEMAKERSKADQVQLD